MILIAEMVYVLNEKWGIRVYKKPQNRTNDNKKPQNRNKSRSKSKIENRKQNQRRRARGWDR